MDQDEQRLSGDHSAIEGIIGSPGQRLDSSGLGRYRTTDEAAAHPVVDAVDICLPAHLHAPAAPAAVGAREHVLPEKPMLGTGPLVMK
jgi:predicted dehydrogenase